MSQALLRRILPSLAFATALAALVAIFYDPSYSALSGAEKRYEQAKRSAAALRLDNERVDRDSREKLVEEFKSIYETAPDWPDRPLALFQMAENLEDLARHSLGQQDLRRAVNVYEEFATKHPKNKLADDALLRAARLRAAWLKDEKGALALISLLKKRYPTGDMLPEAISLEKSLIAASRGRTVSDTSKAPTVVKQPPAENPPVRVEPAPKPDFRYNDAPSALKSDDTIEKTAVSKADVLSKTAPARLTMLSWDSPNKESVEITLVLSGPATSSLGRQSKSREGGRMRLTLDKVLPAKEVEQEIAVRDSLLRGIRTSRNNGSTVLDFDFRQEVTIVANPSPGKIVVRAETVKKTTPVREERHVTLPGPESVSTHLTKADLKNRRLEAMANQLGLTMGKVFIDPGHGGRDHGAEKNNISEHFITLDVALALGRLLENKGLEVAYSRTTDKTFPLNARTSKANEANADIFVSIHINANDDPSIHGLEVYYLDFAANAEAARVAALENAYGDLRLGAMQRLMADVMVNARVEESRKLAGNIQRLASSRLKQGDFALKNNGVKAAPFHVLIGAHMPAVLVELGYCTNSAEADRLANPNYRRALAEGLAEGILAYKNNLKGAHKMQADLEQ